jgi:hypothetical protein
VVSVILINEAFEYVTKSSSLILKMFAWKLCSLPYFTLVVDIVVLVGGHPLVACLASLIVLGFRSLISLRM